MTGTINEPIDLNGSPDSSNGALQVIDPGTTVTLAGAINLATTSGIGGGSLPQNFTISGKISGSGGLVKYGANTLTLSGSVANNYTGSTTISDGTLTLAKNSGVNAIPGDFTLSNANTFVIVQNANQFPSTAKVTFSGSGNPHFEVYGNNVTVGGISSAVGGVIENTELETGRGNGTLTINNSTNCSYDAYIRNNSGGSGTLALVKSGAGTLTLTGPNCGQYSGGLTVNAGTLDLTNGVLPGGTISVAGGTLILPGGAHYGSPIDAGIVDESASQSAWITSSTLYCNGTLVVPEGGTSTFGAIVGTGTTQIADSGMLSVTSLVQDSLIIGGASPIVPVPEPSTLLMLVFAALGMTIAYLRKK
jgi:autotransporter-associated beta strand protein